MNIETKRLPDGRHVAVVEKTGVHGSTAVVQFTEVEVNAIKMSLDHARLKAGGPSPRQGRI